MKIFTFDISTNKPSAKAVTVSKGSEFKIGLKVTNNGADIPFAFLMNGKPLESTSAYEGYALYDCKALDKAGFQKYVVTPEHGPETPVLVSTVNSSATVISGGGSTAELKGEYDDGTAFSISVVTA